MKGILRWLMGVKPEARAARLLVVVAAVVLSDVGVLPERAVDALRLGLGVPGLSGS